MMPAVDRRGFLHAALGTSAAVMLGACGHASANDQHSTGVSTIPNVTATPTTILEAASTTVTAATAPTTSVAATSTAPVEQGGPAAYVKQGPPTSAAVALTFHLDGKPALVTKLLDALRDAQLKVTCFAVGSWLTAHPALGQRVVADGHELGNHTEHHLSMLKLNRDQVRAEIVDGGEALRPFIGSIGRWFRPSGTDVPNQIILDEAGRAGYRVSVGYDIDSLDYTEPGASTVVSNVTSALHPGAIVSLHFGHADTIVALPQIVAAMQKDGLQNVTVGQLLG